jgi:hypothetical protein
MRLHGDANHRDPSAAQIRAAFEHFSPDGEFLILEKSPEEYIQAAPGRIEYRDASGQYFADTQYSDELACRLFVSYLENEEWRRMAPWRPLADAELAASRPGGMRKVALVLLVLGVVAVVVALVLGR